MKTFPEKDVNSEVTKSALQLQLATNVGRMSLHAN